MFSGLFGLHVLEKQAWEDRARRLIMPLEEYHEVFTPQVLTRRMIQLSRAVKEKGSPKR